MDQTAACVLSTRSESFSLRLHGSVKFSLSSCWPPSAGQQAACQLVKAAKNPQSQSLPGFEMGVGSYKSIGAVPKRRGLRNMQSAGSVMNASSGGKVLPVGTSYSANDQTHRACLRLDSRVDLHYSGRRLLDCPRACVAGLGNVGAFLDKARRKSNTLILNAEDLPHHPSNFGKAGTGIASQKSLVLPKKVSDASRQLCVAVDVDEVLGSFLATLNLFIEETYSVHHDISEYYIYDFMKIWNCSQVEANLRVHAFFDSDHFKNGINPIPGAHQTLLQLASYCQLVVVTSRQHVIRDRTLEWIDQYYAGIFKEVHFGNHFALEGPSRRKSEICRSLGANVLIDDNPRYAIDCAECGIEVLLFDLHGGYPWSKTPCGPQHPLITRVKDWQEVEQALLARTFVEL